MSPKPKFPYCTAISTACAVSILCFAQGALAADVDKVSATVEAQTKAEIAAVMSQKKIEKLDDEASKAIADYRRMVAEEQSLKSYNDQLAMQVASQEVDIADMGLHIEEIVTTSREVLPLMNKMLDTLISFVKLDLPFLPEERQNRIAQLQLMMPRADVSTSEKYRRLVEAYQIEVEYGRTIEVYQGKVGDRTVEFLRSGRISLMYSSLDGKETGYWDAEQGTWVKDNEYHEVMKEAIKVAKKQAAPDFIEVAIQAPKEVL